VSDPTPVDPADGGTPPDPADPADPPDPADPTDPGAGVTDRRRPSVRWGAVSGIVVLVYTVVYAAALVGIGDRNQFNRWGRAMSSLGARLVLCGVVLAALFHLFDGLRRLAVDLRPDLADQDERWRATALFFTWALAVPAAAVIVWPWISATTR
jgi:succinate dehydrogenase cytochrome b556 subunit